MVRNFKEFLDNLIVEALHPDLQEIIKGKDGTVSKKTILANKIKELSAKGEKTGIEGNMPSGSSRAYMKHEEKHPITLDGKPEKISVGTKVAIRGVLEKHHNKSKHDGKSLGALQNEAEGGDHWVNHSYRVLTQGDNKGEYHSNHEHGIFPPLIDHDHDNHEWTHVGHSDDVSKKQFKDLTKTKEHPKGISHDEFCSALERTHNRQNGKYWGSKHEDTHLDHVDEHPLVQKFADYHNNTGHPPNDYRQIKNMGVFHHPDGSKHIVARDHGFNTDVASAYHDAFNKSRY
ncbi:hypothetical protein M0R04_04305 [Candidatus Dojkabacteria bacterium]|jgi:hypothetical protein|nr:hypothetical protein [Candidatus Dojkabacteria bacterium]